MKNAVAIIFFYCFFALLGSLNAQDVSKPVVFNGNVTSGSANSYTLQALVPNGFLLSDGVTLVTKINIANTGASTLTTPGFTAKPINKQTAVGLLPLGGGELLAGGQEYSFTYSATNGVYILTTTLSSGVTYGSTSHTISIAEWANGQLLVVNTGSQTLTLPASSSLSNNGGIILCAVGVSVTVALANGTDTINGGSAGASAAASSKLTLITTDGAGHFSMP